MGVLHPNSPVSSLHRALFLPSFVTVAAFRWPLRCGGLRGPERTRAVGVGFRETILEKKTRFFDFFLCLLVLVCGVFLLDFIC